MNYLSSSLGYCTDTGCKLFAVDSIDTPVADNTDVQCVAEQEVQENFQQVLK